MIRLLLICLICWLTTGSGFAQPKLPAPAKSVFTIDSLPVQGIVLNQGWRWHEGDNLNWAKPDIDDQYWQAIDPSQDITELANIQQRQRGWLRLHMRVDSTLLGKVISMLIEQQVASQLYLNGQLIGGFGQLSTDPNQVKAYNPSGANQALGQAIHFQLGPQADQVLAVRVALQPGIHYLKFFDRPNPFLLIRLHQADQRNQNRIDSSGNFDLMFFDYFKVGLFSILALLHLLFYVLYPAHKANLWFSLYCFFAAAIYLNQPIFYQYVHSVADRMHSAIAQWVFIFGAHLFILGAVYTLFKKQVGFVFYTAFFGFSVYLILFTLQVNMPTDLATILALILTDIETTRLLLLAARNRGNEYWVLTIGAGSFVLLISAALVIPYLAVDLSMKFIIVQVFFNVGTLSLPLSITLFLASQFAKTNRSLAKKLKQVEHLSTLMRTQEQEKQQILARQNETLEQQVTLRTAQLKQSLTELKSTQTQLIHQEKMASLGKLTKGIMDRMLNPLNYINNFSLTGKELLGEIRTVTQKHQATFLADEQDDLENATTMLAQNLTKIHEHGNSTARILQDMQKLLKERSSTFVLTDLNSYLTQQIDTCFPKALANYPALRIQLELQLAPQPLLVNLLPHEFSEVLTSLVDNACYALAEKCRRVTGFEPRLEISTVEIEDQVQLQVRDNGRGIPPKEASQLFSPFFTTKATAKGSGLSLYLSKEVVEANLHGQIRIDSVEEQYTQVTILLPLKSELATTWS
ncbi:ATP-binding protein [Spirosoma endophyticum]|uniref:histidine kinase n=1 Tax=Spirosoma endophyticum TaxID=662367 RepID=A0A1I2CI72_9BACT|nr:ATP-binding protein [Spirosoma endophyticum]SFE68021.1 Histidine kinase-, DNA gyrase B-, and HSP90-like ATPase [Spirosoma endophyticum]